jgi:hypothetical protein
MNNPLPLCPSAQPDMPNSIALGVMVGTVDEPYFVHFQKPKQVTEGLLALTEPVKPTEVFRFAATCMGSGCVHFDGTNCRLVQQVVENLPTVAEMLPPCHIRSSCRWYQQEGKAACLRCPQVVTDRPIASVDTTK